MRRKSQRHSLLVECSAWKESVDNKHGNGAIPILRVKKGASLGTIYEAARQAFSAADLQKYTEIEEGIPAEEVLAELEAVDRNEGQRRSRKPKNGRSQ
jgi:hypothetical protein